MDNSENQRVWYSGYCDVTKAAESRFGQAIFKHEAQARCWRLFGSNAFSVHLRPCDVAGFAALAKVELSYSSPDYFDNGTITPIYDSPEDEVAGNQAARYRSFLERQERGK